MFRHRWFEIIDTDRYDILEKKSYKIERLKDEIETAKQTVETTKKLIEYYTEFIGKKEKEILDLTKELKELE